MSEGLAAALLLLAFVAWMLLPLIPALLELLRPTDATPLAMVGQDAGELTYFADRFRGYLQEQLARSADASTAATGRFADGTSWVRMPLAEHGSAAARVDAVVLADPDTWLPSDGVYTMELFARGDLTCGARTVVRALLADGACELGDGSDVLRWVHAEGVLRAGVDATLHGRATSHEAIELRPGVRFARLRAPRIASEGASGLEPLPPLPAEEHTALTPFVPTGATRLGDGYLRVDGSLVVPPCSLVRANLIVRGDLRLEAGSRVQGAVKAHGSVTVGRDVVVDGAVVAQREVHVDAGARLLGVVIAEGAVELAARVQVGCPDRPATIAAPRVRLAPGVTVHGAINTADGAVEAPGTRAATRRQTAA
ncbi:polymer-forming cytoskeletal protein [Roseisolibacter agri]|uniref:Polymer-forming cytoskeletal n=1 Tax=Roseisolibacter agri TaxID=2014610 RepID=A0AA37QGU4_9BACT|nr:polymer-forming cytoskeletal protein [Roseisolibacter agri]GLC26145.1 hypothetical protein rosag_26580 [Roseisolibacter agri]